MGRSTGSLGFQGYSVARQWSQSMRTSGLFRETPGVTTPPGPGSFASDGFSSSVPPGTVAFLSVVPTLTTMQDSSTICTRLWFDLSVLLGAKLEGAWSRLSLHSLASSDR